MTQVGVHAHEHIALRHSQAVEHGGAQSSFAAAGDKSHPCLAPRRDEFDGAILAIVIHDQHVDVQPVLVADFRHPVHEMREVLGFLVGGDNYGEARHAADDNRSLTHLGYTGALIQYRDPGSTGFTADRAARKVSPWREASSVTKSSRVAARSRIPPCGSTH